MGAVECTRNAHAHSSRTHRRNIMHHGSFVAIAIFAERAHDTGALLGPPFKRTAHLEGGLVR
eukprot:9326749-Alexandrium_andersonii.AAC.1